MKRRCASPPRPPPPHAALAPKAQRVFFAVTVTAEIRAKVLRLARRLAATHAQVRWARDEGLHATVKFLGPTSPEQLDAIRRALSAALAAFPRFSAGVSGLGVFPDMKRPRVLWVGMQSSELETLAGIVDQVAARSGFRPERRGYRPHLTLGRVRGARGWVGLERELQSHAIEDFGRTEIGELIAYRSDLRPGGAVYTRLWTIALQHTRRKETHGLG